MNEAPTNRLRELREHAGLSRAAIAVEAGVGEQQVRRWENNELLISTRYLPALTEFLEVSADHLLGLDRTDSPAQEASAA